MEVTSILKKSVLLLLMSMVIIAIISFAAPQVYGQEPDEGMLTQGQGGIKVICNAQKNGVTSEDSFAFNLSIDKTDGDYQCTIHTATGDRELHLKDGKLKFDLKDGESLECKDMPAGTKYDISSPRKIGYTIGDLGTAGTVRQNTVHNITFKFTWKTVALRTSVTGGRITAGETEIPIGDSRQVKIIPARGYHIGGVSVNGVKVENFSGDTLNLDNMTEDKEVIAICEKDEPKPNIEPYKDEVNKDRYIEGYNIVDENLRTNEDSSSTKEAVKPYQAPETPIAKTPLQYIMQYGYIPGFAMSAIAAGLLTAVIAGDIRLLRWCKGKTGNPRRRR